MVKTLSILLLTAVLGAGVYLHPASVDLSCEDCGRVDLPKFAASGANVAFQSGVGTMSWTTTTPALATLCSTSTAGTAATCYTTMQIVTGKR